MDGVRDSAGTTAGCRHPIHIDCTRCGRCGWQLQWTVAHAARLHCFSILGGTTFIVRYVTVANQLEQSTVALEERTRQLAQSYEDLRETQEELVRKEQLAVVGELAAVAPTRFAILSP